MGDLTFDSIQKFAQLGTIPFMGYVCWRLWASNDAWQKKYFELTERVLVTLEKVNDHFEKNG